MVALQFLVSLSALCKKVIDDNRDSCMNLECPSGNGTRVPLNTISLNLKVNLKDNTGYLIGCRLSGDAAERVLGCTANEFQVFKIIFKIIKLYYYTIIRFQYNYPFVYLFRE